MDKSHILLYHGVTNSDSMGIENSSGKHIKEEEFESQMKWLSKNKKVVPLKEVNKVKGSVAITFDDAFKNVHDVALPILKKYDLPSTFFITTGFVENKRLFWVDKVEHMINYPKNSFVELNTHQQRFFPISNKEDKLYTMNIIKAMLKKLDPNARDKMIKDLESQIGLDKNRIPENYQTLSWKDVKNLHDLPKYEVGGHTVNHEILSYLDDARLEHEIGDCIETLSKKLGKTIDSFSYPEGQEMHYNDGVISVLKKHGIKICPSAIDGVVDKTDDNFNLKRIMVGFWGRKFPFKEYYND